MLTEKFIRTVLTTTAVLTLAIPAHATFVARYLDSTVGVDAYFDNATGLTWLRDVHHADGTFNLTNPSSLTWVGANAWATGLGSGWNLPTTVDYSSGEMLTLFNEGFMTSAYFQGLVTDPAMRPVYWSSTELPGWGGAIHYNFYPTPGTDSSTDSILAYSNTYAFAVYSGDIGRLTEEINPPGNTVPEPASILLTLSALGGLGVIRRRKSV